MKNECKNSFWGAFFSFKNNLQLQKSPSFPDFPKKYVKKRENSRDFPNFFRNPYKNLGISGKKPQKWGKKCGISRNPEYLHFSLIMHFHLFFLTYLCSR